jgi:NNP family nitrate/nitrite transporter-like MFS transporter
MLMFTIVFVSFVWMHVAIRRMERRRHPALADERYLSDVPDLPHPAPDIQKTDRAGPGVGRSAGAPATGR